MTPTTDRRGATRTTTQSRTQFDKVEWGESRNLTVCASLKVAPDCNFALVFPDDADLGNANIQAIALTTNAGDIGQPGRLKGSNLS